MRTFTVVVPRQPMLPRHLALLLTPIRAGAAKDSGRYVGRTDGLLLDADGHALAFLLRLTPRLAGCGARTLVPVAAMTSTDDCSTLHLSWTEDQLWAQPRLDGGTPVEGEWAPRGSGVVAREPGVNEAAVAAAAAFEGGIVGAPLDVLTGLAFGGPIGPASLDAFFAPGGRLAGRLSGASEGVGVLGDALHVLERHLRGQALETTAFVQTTLVTPTTADGEMVSGWR